MRRRVDAELLPFTARGGDDGSDGSDGDAGDGSDDGSGDDDEERRQAREEEITAMMSSGAQWAQSVAAEARAELAAAFANAAPTPTQAAAISARQAALEQARAERAWTFVHETAENVREAVDAMSAEEAAAAVDHAFDVIQSRTPAAAAAAPAPAAAAGQPSLNDLHMNLYRRAMADAPDHSAHVRAVQERRVASGPRLPSRDELLARRMAAADWEAAASGEEEGTASPPRPWERDGPSEGALAGMVRSHEEALRRWLDAHSDDADAAVGRLVGDPPPVDPPSLPLGEPSAADDVTDLLERLSGPYSGPPVFADTGDPDNEHEEQRQSQREQRLTGWLERRRSGAPYVTADGIADPIADRSLDGGEPSLEDSAAAAVRELPESLVQRHRDAGAAFPLLTSIREVMDYEAMMERGETSHDDAVASIVARRRQPPPPAGPSEELDRRILAQAALANMEEAEDPRIRMRETFERRESGDGGLMRLADADLTRPPPPGDRDGERLGRLLLRGLGRSVRRGADAPPGDVDPIDPSLASHLGIALDRPDGPFGNRAAVVDSDDDDGDTTRAVRGMWRGIGGAPAARRRRRRVAPTRATRCLPG